MKFRFPGRSRDRRRRWTLAIAYAVLLASCESPFAPDVQQVARLDINPTVLTMVVGANATLVARVYGIDDALIPAAKVFWSTQDPTVVTVSQDGRVNAVAAGTAQIAASSGGQSRTIAVTVSQKPIALVRIAPPAATVAAGQTFRLQGEALDGDGNVLPNRALEWSSSHPTIATVDATGLVSGVAIGQATINAIGEGKVGTAIVTVQPTPVATLTIAPNGGTVPAGGTLQFSATARDANGQVLTGRTMTWRSSNDAVATVSGLGLMTAISPGTATITVSAPNAGPNGSTPSASVSVTVLIEPVSNAVIVPSPVGIQVGGTATLTVNLFNAGGNPISAAGRTIGWTTNNPNVASVNSSGTVMGVSVGNASITATITTPGQAGTVQASVPVNVSNQPVVSVVVTPSPATIHVGYSRQLTAVAMDANNQPLTGRPIVWTSSNQAVATVDAGSGVVVGVGQGAVQIRATAEGIQGQSNVTIDLVRVNSVSVAPPTVTIMPSQTAQLSATPRDSAGNAIQGPALGNRPTFWASSSTAAATVGTNGLVTGVAQGASTITATIGGTAGQAQVTVSPLPSATQLAITTQPPASAPNDAAFATQPVVQLKDVNGNNVATAGVVITAAITAPGTGVLGGTATASTNASGAATFTNLKITGTTGARTLTFTSGALTPATSSGINVTPGAATQLLLVTSPPSTANSGQALLPASVLQLQDVSGNNVPQTGVLVTAAVSPAGATLAGGSTTTDGSGLATFGALTLTGSAGGYTLTFSSGSLTPAISGTITLSAGSGSKLAVLVQPSTSAQNGAGFGTQPQVQLQDGSGNPVAQAGVQVTAGILSGGGTLGGTIQVLTNASGIATFTNLSITGTVGDRTLLFAAVNYTSVGSGTINITAGPPAALFLASPPSATAQSGAAFGAQPAIQVLDASGNPVLQAGTNVTATLNGAGGTLIGSNSAATDGNGLATFSGLGISGTVGSYSLTFSSGALNTSSGTITLSAGTAAQLTITTQPGGAASGVAFTTQPVIQVRDAQGNPVLVAGTNVTASIASGPAGATLLGGSASTDGSGQAIFTGLGLSGTVGSYTIKFDAGPLSVTSGSITLAHGAAATLTIQTQPSGATNGAAFTTQPVIQVLDAQLNPVPNVSVSATPSAGASLVGSGSATSDASGLATFSGLGISGLVGNYTIDFSASGVPNVTSGTIALGAGPATKLVMSGQPPASVANGATFSASVQLQDAAGNPVGTTGTPVSVALVGGGAVLGGTTPVNTTGGIATFNDLTITGTVGNYSLSFSSSGLTGVGSSQVTLTPGAAAKLAIATAPAGATSGAAFGTQPAIQVLDAQNNAVGAGGLTVTAAIASGSGSLTGSTTATTSSGVATFSDLGISGTVGAFTLSFTSSPLTGVTSGSITLAPGAPAQVTIQTEPAGATSGAAFGTQPVVLVSDAQGNVVGAGITVTASPNGGASLVGSASAATNGSGVATFSGLGLSGLVGNYTVTFTSGTGQATSGTIALGAGAASKLVMSAQPPSTIANGGTFTAAVQVQDAAGNPLNVDGLPVSVALNGAGGTLTVTSPVNTASGVATFSDLAITGLVGNYSLTFSSGSLTSATSSPIALTHGAATQVVFAPAPPGAANSGTALASHGVQLKDASGNNVLAAGVNVTVGIAPTGVTLAGNTAATNASGVATFTGLTITLDVGTTSPYTGTLTYTADGIAGTLQSGITLTAFYQLSIVTQPGGAKNGQAFTSQPVIQIVDALGNPSSQGMVSVTASIFSGAGSLGGTVLVATNTSGLATFTDLVIGHNGSHQLRFLTANHGTVLSNPFVVNP